MGWVPNYPKFWYLQKKRRRDRHSPPKKIWNQIVPKLYGHWNGDVWKAIVEARTWKNINTFTIIADHGLGVIQKKDNSNILLEEIDNYKKLKFKDYYIKHKEFINLVEYTNYIKFI